jgi:two-component system response regulator VicR
LKILVIDDEPRVIDLVSVTLAVRWPDAKVIGVSRGQDGITSVENESPDAIILDIGLPDMSGFEVLKQIRLFSNTPILVLTGDNEEAVLVKALELGADDFMAKPFRQLELLSRVNGIMKHQRLTNEKELGFGDLRFEPASMRVWCGSKEISITNTEGLILGELMKYSGNVVPYSRLSELMWGDTFPEAHDSIKVHVQHLREKLAQNIDKPHLILNKQSIGYFLASSA